MRISAAFVPLVALALTVTACSSSTKGNGTKVTTPATTGTTPATTAASSTATTAGLDATHLKALLLTKDDVPSGWTGTPPDSKTSADAAKGQAEVAACIGLPDPDIHKVAEADSDNFDLDNSEISSSATSYPSESDVQAGLALLTNPKAGDCYKKLFSEQVTKDMPAGGKVDNLDVKLTPGTNGGPSNVVAKAVATITISAQGQTAELFIDSWFIKGKQVGVDVDFFGFGKPIDAAIQATAVKAVADRVAAA